MFLITRPSFSPPQNSIRWRILFLPHLLPNTAKNVWYATDSHGSKA